MKLNDDSNGGNDCNPSAIGWKFVGPDQTIKFKGVPQIIEGGVPPECYGSTSGIDSYSFTWKKIDSDGVEHTILLMRLDQTMDLRKLKKPQPIRDIIIFNIIVG